MVARIAVIGQSGLIPPELRETAYQVGRAIARRGGLLFCGGRDGVMEAACSGAKAAGGTTVGILPGDDLGGANAFVDIPVTTGQTMEARSLVLIHSSDAVIMLGGGNGTLGELSAAYMYGKPVVVLPFTGGWSARIREIAYEGKYLDHRKNVEILYAGDPETAVAQAFERIHLARGASRSPE